MSLIDKKQKEKEVAIFFCQHFNRTHNGLFKAEEDDKDEEADYLLADPEGKSIKLQITMYDQVVIQSILDARKTPGQISAVYDLNHVEKILRAIKDKCKYSKAVQKEVILLIYSDIARFDEKYLQSEIEKNCPENSFKEIYLVELPKTDPAKSSHLSEGNVIKLK